MSLLRELRLSEQKVEHLEREEKPLRQMAEALLRKEFECGVANRCLN